VAVSVVIPCYNSAAWLPGCLDSLRAQTMPPAEILLIDNGSADDSLAVAATYPELAVVALGENTGFAVASNRGLRRARAPYVALLNPDVELEPDWIARMAATLAAHPSAASVACKMTDLMHPGRLYDTGDVLRRDGVCEQRGRFEVDTGAYDAPGEIFGACAGAALYDRDAVLSIGGFDERFFLYMEDVDLALRLRLAGWTARYEPVVARHVGESSPPGLDRPVRVWVQRNTLLMIVKTFPLRWLPLVLYRQLGWARHAARTGQLALYLRGTREAVGLLRPMLATRRRLRREAVRTMDEVVPRRPIRGG